MGIGVPSSGMKRSWRQTDLYAPSDAEFKSKWSCTATPSACLHGVDRESFTFTRVMLARFLLKLTKNQNFVFTRPTLRELQHNDNRNKKERFLASGSYKPAACIVFIHCLGYNRISKIHIASEPILHRIKYYNV
jgi:hypothetical protein